MHDSEPRPTIEDDQMVVPRRSRAQDSVGSEGGAASIGTPRRVNTDVDVTLGRRETEPGGVEVDGISRDHSGLIE